MKKDKMENEVKKPSAEIFLSVGNYIKHNYKVLIVFVVSFLVVSAVGFIRISTSNTLTSYKIEDYDVGMIADKNIYAQKTLPADTENPVTVQKGERVMRKGYAITEEEYAKLKKMAQSPSYIDLRAFADLELYLLLLSALWFMLFGFVSLKKKLELKEIILEAICFVLIFAATIFGSKTVIFSSAFALPVIIPATFCTFLISILFGQLSAIFFSIIMSFGVLGASGFMVVPALFVLASSIASCRIVRNIQRRIDLVFASLLQSLLNVVFLGTFKVIFTDSFTDAILTIPGVAFNGFISGILALGFLTPLESLMNTASVFRLMDLSDLNTPIMKKMLLTASGTYSHSLMVASLAEAACREIGANSLLARVGSYYHDIGKIDQSEYFVENQSGENKHDEINPNLSVSIIRSHVKKGVEKAQAMHFPKEIINIIGEHHGNQVIAYFYNEALKVNPNAKAEDYSYMGTPPTTRESAVVMLADTVEAACRTLEKPSVPRLDKFIQQLIEGKIQHGQLVNCDLTFKDLTLIRKSFVQILAGYYHSRIEYPDQKDPDEKVQLGEKTLSEAAGTIAPKNYRASSSKENVKEKTLGDKKKNAK